MDNPAELDLVLLVDRLRGGQLTCRFPVGRSLILSESVEVRVAESFGSHLCSFRVDVTGPGVLVKTVVSECRVALSFGRHVFRSRHMVPNQVVDALRWRQL
jgi:hypothetical protein